MSKGTRTIRLNSVIPDVWIIEESLRREREKERRKKESGIPLELPISFPQVDDGTFQRNDQKNDKEEHVVIIDL
jgi:hypothetical protein